VVPDDPPAVKFSAEVVPLSGTLDSIGPLARTAEDCGLLTAAMAAADPNDPATLSSPRGDLESALAGDPDVRGVRISALPPEAFPSFTLPDVVRVYREAMVALRDLGAHVDEAPFPLDFDEMMVQNGRIIAAEAYALHRAYIEDPNLDIDPWVKKRVLGGKAISAADYIDLLEQRRRMSAEFARWMRDRDALLTPTLPITATPLADVDEATTPLATASCRHRDAHHPPVSNILRRAGCRSMEERLAAAIIAAVTAVAPAVSTCNPSQAPLAAVTLNAVRHAMPQSATATAIGETVRSRVRENQPNAASVMTNDNQPRKLPAAFVPLPIE